MTRDPHFHDSERGGRGDGLLDQLVGALLPDLREAVRAAVREAVAESNDLGKPRRLG
jgi:hypothetical protein